MPAHTLAEAETRDRFRYFQSISTRWMDNDIYAHVNNVVYYSYVDTVVNEFLIKNKVLDIQHGEVVGFAVESGCQFRSPLTFPGNIEAGLRVAHLGNSSVRYEIGLFETCKEIAAAAAYFVHVFVDRESRTPVPIPKKLKAVLSGILLKGS